MSDRAKKISELTALTSASEDDLLVIVDDPSGTAATKKITVGNLFGNSQANVVIYGATPANSAITIKQGTLMYSNSYLYIAVANNVVKRLSLESF